jgi:hypothetical protein
MMDFAELETNVEELILGYLRHKSVKIPSFLQAL